MKPTLDPGSIFKKEPTLDPDPGYPVLPGPVSSSGSKPTSGLRKYKLPPSPSYSYDTPKPRCDHNYEFKYKKEKVTKEGIIKQNYYFCRRCLKEMIEETVEPQYLKDENCVVFSNFKIPVKDKVHAKEVIKNMNDCFMDNEEILTDYLSESKGIIKKLKKLDNSSLHKTFRYKIFRVISSLDTEYALSNKITSKLYNLNTSLFEKVLRKSIKNNNPIPKAKTKKNISNLQFDFWNKPVTIKYDPKKGFYPKEVIEKFGFLKDVLNRFQKENEMAFKRLKGNANLSYALTISLNGTDFEYKLLEQSIVKKAYKLNKELEELVDKPKELASKIDEFQETSEEIISKCGVTSIEDLIPLYIYSDLWNYNNKKITEFKFSEKDVQAYFFIGDNSTNDPFCIYFSKNELLPNSSQPQPPIRNIEYIRCDKNNIQEVLNILYKKWSISFFKNYKKVEKELKRIEDQALKQAKLTVKNDLERILRIRGVKLPQKWYALRDLFIDSKITNKEVLPFIHQVQESKLLTELLERLKNECPVPKNGGF